MSDYRPSSLTASQRAHREPCSSSRVAGGAGGNILPTFGSSLGCGWVNGVQTPLSSLSLCHPWEARAARTGGSEF